MFVISSVVGCAALALASIPAPRQDSNPSAREWSQARGNPEGTSAVDVDPIRVEPEEAWRASFRKLDSDPVAWGGVLFVVGTQTTGRKLFAIDIETGKPAATPLQLPAGGRGHLAVWQGFVAFVEADGVTFFQHRGKQLSASREKKIPGAFASPPCAAKGCLFVCDSRGSVQCIDLRTGKKLGAFPGGAGRPTVVADESKSKPDDLIVTTIGSGTPPPPDSRHVYMGSYLGLFRTRVSGLGGKEPKFSAIATDWHGVFESEYVASSDLAEAFAARVASEVPGADTSWFVYTPAPLAESTGAEGWKTLMTPNFLSPISTEPAVHAGFACGFSADGALVRFQADGRHAFVIPKADPLPDGALRGRATLARGVLYLENWAVEIESGRVLWCKPDLAPVTALLPVADGRTVHAEKTGDIVCLRAPPAASSLAAEGERSPRAPRPSMPGSGDGVVTAQGSRIEGSVTRLAYGTVRVEGKRGETSVHRAADLALVESGGTVELIGEENPVYLAFRTALDVEALDALEVRIEGYRRAGFPAECQRLLAEARTHDAEGARIRALERGLSAGSDRQSANAPALLERLKKEEAALRETLAGRFRRAGEWCRDRGIRGAASALLRDAHRIRPGDATVLAVAQGLVPKGLPRADAPTAGARWIELSAAILPSGAVVLDREDPAWERARARPWSAGAIGLATRSLLFFSTEEDPVVLGTCLSNGESALRTLEGSLGESARKGGGRLEVWLHWSRDEYLEEFGEAKPAMEWTAGGYDPEANLSRFYVERGGANEAPIERALHSVLVHELTHHYTADRFGVPAVIAGLGSTKAKGFWLVEGLAEFFEGQVVEMGRRGGRLDDETVPSIDSSARILDASKLFPMERLLTMTQEDFARLGSGKMGTVQLRNTVGAIELTWKSVFYSQAGSLVYFLWNRGGPERRAALVASLREWLEGKGSDEPWVRLGYASAAELDEAYRAFLREAGH